MPDIDVHTWNDDSEMSDVDDFSDFLLKSSRFSDIDHLDIGGDTKTRKLVLVEVNDRYHADNRYYRCLSHRQSLPNRFYDEPMLLHDVLGKYRRASRCPLVLILSDSSQNWHFSPHCLVPPAVRTQLQIDHIAFNTIAVTLMKKALLGVIRRECAPGVTLIDDVVAIDWLVTYTHTHEQMGEKEQQALCKLVMEGGGGEGDIRGAINALQAIMQPMTATTRAGGSGKRAANGGPASVWSKDDSLSVFRAVGKLLYGKSEARYRFGDSGYR